MEMTDDGQSDVPSTSPGSSVSSTAARLRDTSEDDAAYLDRLMSERKVVESSAGLDCTLKLINAGKRYRASPGVESRQKSVRIRTSWCIAFFHYSANRDGHVKERHGRGATLLTSGAPLCRPFSLSLTLLRRVEMDAVHRRRKGLRRNLFSLKQKRKRGVLRIDSC